MKVRNLLLFSLLLLLPLGLFSQSAHDHDDHEQNYDEQFFVVLQLPAFKSTNPDSMSKEIIKPILAQINDMNAAMGYDRFEKHVASFNLQNEEVTTPYLAVRMFEGIESAKAYGVAMDQHLGTGIYGLIKESFPVSRADFDLCYKALDFTSYFERYKQSN